MLFSFEIRFKFLKIKIISQAVDLDPDFSDTYNRRDNVYHKKTAYLKRQRERKTYSHTLLAKIRRSMNGKPLSYAILNAGKPLY